MTEEIIKKLLQFRDERDWKKFHAPENLAKSICIESGELLELFQWDNNPGISFGAFKNLKHELADICIYVIYLCEHYGLSIKNIIEEKIEVNAINYPLSQSKGNANRNKIEFKTKRLI